MSEQRKPGDKPNDHDHDQREATLQARRDFLMLLSQGTFIAAAGLTAACDDLPAAPTTGSGGSSSSSSGSLTPSRSTLRAQRDGEEGPPPGLLV